MAWVISGGTLVVAAAGALGSGGVSVDGGMLLIPTGVTVTNDVTTTSGVVGGEGTITSATTLEIGTGVTIKPGASVGTLTTSAENWNTDGTFEFELNDLTGGTGSDPGWDKLEVEGQLTITATSGGGEFIIDITSLNLAGDPGLAENFSYGVYDLLFVDSTDAISGFAADKFTLSVANFDNPKTSWEILLGTDVTGGDNTQLYLRANVIPEPTTLALLALAGASVLRRRR
jgi:hypothetical protein